MSIIERDTLADIDYDEAKAYRGYTLFTPVGGSNVYLIDMKGCLVHSWNLPFPLGNHGELLPNGNLLCAAKIPEAHLADFDGATGKLLEIDWNGNVVWQYEDPYMHHDFCRLPNGDTILLRWVPTPGDIASKIKGGLSNTEREGIIWSDSLREINSDGEIVWEWLAYEHLDTEKDVICHLCSRSQWTHVNSFIVTDHGDILISFMKINSIMIINKETGGIDWRWGGFLQLGHPHDVCWWDNEDVIVFGSGGHLAGFEQCNSELLRINTKTGNLVWEYREPYGLQFFAPCLGGLQPYLLRIFAFVYEPQRTYFNSSHFGCDHYNKLKNIFQIQIGSNGPADIRKRFDVSVVRFRCNVLHYQANCCVKYPLSLLSKSISQPP